MDDIRGECRLGIGVRLIGRVHVVSSRRAVGDTALDEALEHLASPGTSVTRTEADCALAVLPYGTANDFAAALGIPADPREALRDLLASETGTIDVGRAGDRWFVNVVAAGFGANGKGIVSDGL